MLRVFWLIMLGTPMFESISGTWTKDPQWTHCSVWRIERLDCRWFLTWTISTLVFSDGVRWFRTVISDDVRWNRTVISDGMRWFWTPRWIRTVISDAQLSSLFYHHFVTSIANFEWWFRTVISDGDFGRCDVWNNPNRVTELYAQFCTNVGNFGRWFRTVLCIRKSNTAI